MPVCYYAHRHAGAAPVRPSSGPLAQVARSHCARPVPRAVGGANRAARNRTPHRRTGVVLAVPKDAAGRTESQAPGLDVRRLLHRIAADHTVLHACIQTRHRA